MPLFDRTKSHPEKSASRLESTIAGLRVCSAAQNDLIANFEDYQKKVEGVKPEGLKGESVREADKPAGYSGNYGAELHYLNDRRQAIDSLIAAVERYNRLAPVPGVLARGVERDPSENPGEDHGEDLCKDAAGEGRRISSARSMY